MCPARSSTQTCIQVEGLDDQDFADGNMSTRGKMKHLIAMPERLSMSEHASVHSMHQAANDDAEDEDTDAQNAEEENETGVQPREATYAQIACSSRLRNSRLRNLRSKPHSIEPMTRTELVELLLLRAKHMVKSEVRVETCQTCLIRFGCSAGWLISRSIERSVG